MPIPKKKDWLDLAIEVANFHISQLKDDHKWTVAKTAVALNRSVGSVSQSITIGMWTVTHERQLRKFSCMKDAIEFISERKREMKIREI